MVGLIGYVLTGIGPNFVKEHINKLTVNFTFFLPQFFEDFYPYLRAVDNIVADTDDMSRSVEWEWQAWERGTNWDIASHRIYRNYSR